MMSIIQMKALGIAALFVLLFASGFWMGQWIKPYHPIPLTIHKFLGLGALAFVIIVAHQTNQIAPLNLAMVWGLVFALFFFLVTIITGGLVSVETQMPTFVYMLHKALPYCTLLASGISLYLLLGPN
jgi:hypothetical protein